MRIVFMGTPDFAVPALRALIYQKYDVVAVVTQPDRPGGRGKRVRPSPVKEAAQKAGLPVLQPEKMHDPVFLETLGELSPDLVVVAAYGKILPVEILQLPPYGCVNVHASLLPAYRGAAPIHRAVINGEKETGITIMQMDTGLDTGDIIMKDKIEIGSDDTVGTVHDRLAALGGRLLLETLRLLKEKRVRPVPQDGARSSYAPVLTRDDEIIHWGESALAIKNLVRGLNPWPGARTHMVDKLLKIWQVTPVRDYPANAAVADPGYVLAADPLRGILVQTGDGVIAIEELQLQGKKNMTASDFLRGNPIKTGTVLGQVEGAAVVTDE